MLAGTAARAGTAVATAAGRCSLFPFLYLTRTISSGHPRGEHDQRQRGGRTTNARFRKDDGPRRRRPQTTSQRAKSPSIPFERVPARQDPYSELELEGSTITPNERKAFESLFNLRFKSQVTQTDDGKVPAIHADSDALLNVAGEAAGSDGRPKPELPPALQALLKDVRATASGEGSGIADAMGSMPHRASQAWTMNAAASKELHNVSKAMDVAKTDVQIWEILRTQVLDRLTVVEDPEAAGANLDRAIPRMNSSGKIETAHTSSSSRMETIAQALPEHLVRTLKRLSTDFPASPLPFSILPTLKSLGPNSFALGVSTTLYNLHMRLLYERYTDLPAVVDVLNEMEEGEHEANGQTLELLDDILIVARQAENGEHGAGVQLMWKMERFQGPLVRIAEWRKALVHRFEDKALRLAGQRDSTGSATETELRA